jgi:hypothetical protein
MGALRNPIGRLGLASCLILGLTARGSAATIELPRSTLKAEKKLHRWLNHESAVRDRIAALQTQADAESDLKDAVSDTPESAAPAPRNLGCEDFPSCRVPILELDTQPGEPLEPAVLAMLKPWIWLAEFRGKHLVLTTARKDGGAEVFTMSIPGFDLRDVQIKAVVRPAGGLHLAFDRGLELDETYSRQRGTLDRTKAFL